MPVSPMPFYTTVLFVLIPVIGRIKAGRRGLWLGIGVSILIYGYIVLTFYIPGWTLYPKAVAGDPSAQYEYARWIENHNGDVSEWLIWPGGPDLLAGFAWLEKAAAQDYPPALYLVGLRLKYGDFVPKPPDWPEWRESMGEIYRQPERGQALIDRALKLGFRPRAGDERTHYIRVFRRGEK